MRCGIYCRLSREDRDKQGDTSESIQNQRSLLVNYAAQQGWDIYDLYCDEDYSGADAHRPDFCRLLADARAGRFEVVLCKTQSRFTRDMELVERYIHGAFPRWGIRFVAVADHIDTAVKGNKKARQISGLVNEWYLEDLSENVKLVLDHKRSRGEYIGGAPLYGYCLDPKFRGRLCPDPEAAAVVEEIFHRRLTGMGSRAIAAQLNRAGVDSPARYKARCRGKAEPDSMWSPVAVSRILRNEMYTGTMVQGRRKKLSYKSRTCVDVPEKNWFRVENTHPAIVSRELFEQVQSMTPAGVRATVTGTPHLLAGLVFCGSCGGAMSHCSNGRPGEERREYLRCRRSLPEYGRCTCPSVRLDRLAAAVWGRLSAYLTAAGLTPPQTPERALLLLAVDRIEVFPRDNGRRPVHILWKF